MSFVWAQPAATSLRFPPMRRNWEYRGRAGLYDNDYVPGIWGALTGATVRETSPMCTGVFCAYNDPQTVGFALESTVLTTYRIPALIHDFMLKPDNRRPEPGDDTRP